MKRYFSLLIAFVLILSLCACSGRKDVVTGNEASALKKGSHLKITAFGDSIAAGYGLDSQDDNYLSLFAESIGASLKNNAVSGYDSGDLVSLLSGTSADYDIKNADIIIISIGGNDILHSKEEIISAIKEAFLHGGDYFPENINSIYADFEANLTGIFTKLHSVNQDASIIIQTLYNPALSQEYRISLIDAGKLIDKYITRLNESIISVSSNFDNVFVFDIADEMNGDKNNFYNLQTDFDIHPTKQGHSSLARLFTQYYNEN